MSRSPRHPRPPGWARRLIGLAAGADEAPHVLADLTEEFDELVLRDGIRAARRWYRFQVARSCLSFLAHRFGHPFSDTFSARPALLLRSNLRGALRQLVRAPATSFAAIATMALGAGATAAVLAAVHGVLLQPLPFPEPDQLAWMHTGSMDAPRGSSSSSPGDYEAWREAPSIAAVVAWAPGQDVTVALDGEPWRGEIVRITDGVAAVLGQPPTLGRWFRSEEFVPESHVVMLTYRSWRGDFGGDSSVVGRTVLIDDAPTLIVGVASDVQDAFAAGEADLWRPEPTRDATHGNLYLQMVARLRPGASLERASGELAAIDRRLAAEFPETNANRRAWLEPYREGLVGSVAPTMRLIIATVVLVMLIASGNVTNVLMAQALARQREFAVRSAMGGSAARLTAQVVTEVLVLAGMGLALGLALAPALLRTLLAQYPGELPRGSAVALSPAVILAATAVTLLAALVTVIPVLRQARRGDLLLTLQSEARGGISRRARRAGSLLVSGQVAMAVVLLFGGALLLQSLYTLSRRDPGFDRTGLVALSVAPTAVRFPTDAEAFEYLHRVEEQVARVPGVQAVGFTTLLPYDAGNLSSIFWPAGASHSMDNAFFPITHGVSAGYLRAIGLPLLQGRFLTDADRRGPPVTVVSAGLAERLWPGESAVGNRIETRSTSIEVVGVVGDKRHRSLKEAAPIELYLPREHSWYYSRAHWVVARVTGSPPAAQAALAAAVRRVDPATPAARFTTIEERIDRSIAPERFRGVLVGTLGALALALTALGIWGSVAYLVSRQTRDIGVRIALGQRPDKAGRQVILGAMRTVGGGLVVGVLLSLFTGRFLSAFLVDVAPFDPLSLVAIAGILAVMTALAALGPALRASRIDPITAIRSEGE